MVRHPVEAVIEAADRAIVEEDFDALMDIYADEAVLVVTPGKNARGKAQIREAFRAIAAYFGHTLQVRQAGMSVLEAGDTALVLARTVVSASNLPETERKATYVFQRQRDGAWRCTIDNSYGHDLLPHDVP